MLTWLVPKFIFQKIFEFWITHKAACLPENLSFFTTTPPAIVPHANPKTPNMAIIRLIVWYSVKFELLSYKLKVLFINYRFIPFD